LEKVEKHNGAYFPNRIKFNDDFIGGGKLGLAASITQNTYQSAIMAIVPD
jgi:hypothetical protein